MNAEMTATLSRLDAVTLQALRHHLDGGDPLGVLAALDQLAAAPVAWAVGRLARFHQHVADVSWSLMVDLTDAEVEDAAWWAGTHLGGPEVGDLAATVHAALVHDTVIPWPSSPDPEAKHRLVTASFSVVVGAIRALAARSERSSATLVAELWP